MSYESLCVRASTLVTIGLLVGLGLCLPFRAYLARLLYEISPTDAVTYVSTSVFLFMVALAASYIPARQAARVQPMSSLRHE